MNSGLWVSYISHSLYPLLTKKFMLGEKYNSKLGVYCILSNDNAMNAMYAMPGQIIFF